MHVRAPPPNRCNALLINALLLSDAPSLDISAIASVAYARATGAAPMHGPTLGVSLLAGSLCVLQLAAACFLALGSMVAHGPTTLERRWADTVK